MPARVATIVRCADLTAQVYATVDSIERQTAGRGETALVIDPTTPHTAESWLTRFAADRQLRVIRADSAKPGAGRNAGLRATAAPYVTCIDAGDRFDSRFHAMAAQRLDTDEKVAIVTSHVRLLGPGPEARTVRSSGHDLDALIGDPEAIHSASMFRRSAWEASHGFDDGLDSLEHFEFWLRVLQSGRRAAIVEEPLLVRVVRTSGLYRRAWERDRHAASIERIFAKHAALFARDPARALFLREQILHRLADEYTRLIRRRDEGLREIESLKARVAALRASVPEAERDAVDLGDLRRTAPIARDWGYERGRPIDRHYIERFLEAHAADIRGAVLEVQEPDYTHRFGGGRVERSDVVDLDPSNARATIVSDLRSAGNIPSDSYDCIIVTQTLHVIDDMAAVLRECRRILKPGGVLLATLPAASRVCLEYGRDADFWRLTEAGARTLFEEIFPEEALEIRAHGNVLVNAAFLYGLGCHELTEGEFEAADPYFPLLVTVRAQKEASAWRGPSEGGPHKGTKKAAVGSGFSQTSAAILLYHRVATPGSDVHGLATPPDRFSEQVELLRDEYHVVPLADLVAAARDGRIEPRSIAITFDDGYVDNYTTASPILTAAGLPATFFLTTDRLACEYEFWWDALESILLVQRPVPPTLSIDLPDGRRSFEMTTAAQRAETHTRIYDAIVGAPANVRDTTIQALTMWIGGDRRPRAEDRRMTVDEICALAGRSGHAIGAHTVRHLMLPRQPVGVQREEILQSRVALERLVLHRIRSFAYPFGAFDDETVGAVASSSFDMAVTCEERLVDREVDPLRLPRFEVTPRRAAQFRGWLADLFKIELT